MVVLHRHQVQCLQRAGGIPAQCFLCMSSRSGDACASSDSLPVLCGIAVRFSVYIWLLVLLSASVLKFTSHMAYYLLWRCIDGHNSLGMIAGSCDFDGHHDMTDGPLAANAHTSQAKTQEALGVLLHAQAPSSWILLRTPSQSRCWEQQQQQSLTMPSRVWT